MANKDEARKLGDIVYGAMADFWEHKIYPEFQKAYRRLGGVDNRLDGIDERLDRMELDVKDIRRRVIDMEADTPSRKEFSELEARVNKYHPLN